jgi:hypothetical protein
MGNVYLLGPDSDIWENPNHLDLIAINSKKSDNSLSRLITVMVVDWFHRLVGWRLRVRLGFDMRRPLDTMMPIRSH